MVLYCFWYALLSETGGKLGFLSSYFASISQIMVTNYIWFLAKADTATFTYLLIGNIYNKLSDNSYHYRLSYAIYSGKITSQLMHPLDFFAVQYFKSIGTRLTKNLLMLGGTILGVLFCVLTFANIQAPSWSLLLVILMIPMTLTLNYLFGFLFGSVVFWVKQEYDYDGVRNSYQSIMWILIGSAIPLDKLPFEIGYYFTFLPTSYILHHPMQIYLGEYSPLETFYIFLGGLTWCFVLYFLAKLVFKMGLKKNESVGL